MVIRTTSRRGGNLCLHNNNNTPDSRGNASLLEMLRLALEGVNDRHVSSKPLAAARPEGRAGGFQAQE